MRRCVRRLRPYAGRIYLHNRLVDAAGRIGALWRRLGLGFTRSHRPEHGAPPIRLWKRFPAHR
jgi:hypothetical protein